MKKLLLCLFISLCFLFVSCDKEQNEQIEKEYTIQYVDDFGQHKITVKSGEAYSLDVLPEKYGYLFTGLYDSEVGGTQYVNEKGSALSVFTDNQNLILFPQFKPKEYTLVLDYQGANVTGSRSMKVEYESVIGELPMNLSLENKDFTGWYTEPNREGKQIADKFGVIPVVNQVIEENFDLSDNKGYIYLYAGFKGKEYTVTFYAQDNNSPEEIKVEHGTPISEVVPSTRVNGQAVLSWSKTKGGEVFNGKVTDDMTLYAVEYAPYIELDCNGGNELNDIVARVGSTISLPIPTKDLASFSHWEDSKGNRYVETAIIPIDSITLKAVWNPKIVLDENGGSDVQDISVKVGDNISLPIPEKEGFVFAGWYTDKKEKYTKSTMPSNGIKLRAGWYKSKKEIVVVTTANEPYNPSGSTNDEFMADKLKISLSFLPTDFDGNLLFMVHMQTKCSTKNYTTTPYIKLNYYYQNTMSTSFLCHSETIFTKTELYNNYQFAMSFNLKGNIIYCSRTCNNNPSDYSISDYYIEVYYPDTTNLYL